MKINCPHVHIQAPHGCLSIEKLPQHQCTTCEKCWPNNHQLCCVMAWVHRWWRQCIIKKNNLTTTDGRYPLLPWLMTPFAAITCEVTAEFNIHDIKRGTIKRLNGVLKRRFASLNYPVRSRSKRARTRRTPLHEDHINGPSLWELNKLNCYWREAKKPSQR